MPPRKAKTRLAQPSRQAIGVADAADGGCRLLPAAADTSRPDRPVADQALGALVHLARLLARAAARQHVRIDRPPSDQAAGLRQALDDGLGMPPSPMAGRR